MKKSGMYTAIAALALVSLPGCGGGGSASGDSAVVPTTSVTCTDGSKAATAAQCPVTAIVASIPVEGTADPKVLNQGLAAQYSAPVVTSGAKWSFTFGANQLPGTLTWDSTNMKATLGLGIRVAYSTSYHYVLRGIIDMQGRPVADIDKTFLTGPMDCTDSHIWSSPAKMSDVVHDCVAPVGVEALADLVMNKVQDNTCFFTAGLYMAPNCQKYAANATLLFAETGTTVGGHPVLWAAYFGINGSSNVVLIDATTATAPTVLGVLQLPGTLNSIKGSATGLAIRMDGAPRQVTWTDAGLQLI